MAAMALADAPTSISSGAELHTAADGTELAVWTHGNPAAPTTLLLAHGWTLDHTTWDDVIAGLVVDDDVRVVAYDHRGHGVSGGLVEGSATIDQLADDMLEVVQEYGGAGELVLAGHSMGGMTIMELAARRPDLIADRVRGVGFVSTSAGPFLPRLQRVPVVSRLWSGVLDNMEVQATKEQSLRSARLSARFSMFGSEAKDYDVDRAVAQVRRAAPGTRSGFGLALAAHRRMGALRHFGGTHTVVLCGSRDRQTPLRHSLAIAENVQHSSLTVLPGAGHMLPYERTRAVTRHLQTLFPQRHNDIGVR